VKFNNRFFLQVGGVPAGSCLSTFLCDVVLNVIDNHINTYFANQILDWTRYLDDIFSAVNDKTIFPNILNELNKHHPSIQYTFEPESPAGQLAFLDLLITRTKMDCAPNFFNERVAPSRQSQGALIIRHFIKPSQTNRCISFDSAHPKSMLVGLLRGEITRSMQHCSLNCDKEKNAARIMDKYVCNGYPSKLVDNQIKRYHSREKNGANGEKKTSPQSKEWVQIPYIKGFYEAAQHIFASQGINVIPARGTTLGNLVATRGSQSQQIASVKKVLQGRVEGGHLPSENGDNKGIVYAIPCKDCDMHYVGESGRSVFRRKLEHVADFEHKRPKTRLAQHAIEKHHTPDFEAMQILHHCNSLHTRLQLESYSTLLLGPRAINVANNEMQINKWISYFKTLNAGGV
jgi:hypothetical protein